MLRGSEQTQNRVLALIGTAVVFVVIVVVLFVVSNPFGGRRPDQMSLTIRTPFVGQGVEVGTAVVLHGVEVGHVTNIASIPGGGVRLATDLQQRPVDGLTDSMNIDFRPINYFGVPGVNIIPGPGGQALRDGSEISLVPAGNFTLSELLSQLGDVAAGALTPKLIEVVDRATRYTDGLNPLIETLVIATTAVADEQRVPTAQLLANTAAISTAFPSFADALVDAGTRLISYNYQPGLSVTQQSAAASGPKLSPPFLTEVLTPNLQDESQEYFDNVYKVGFYLAAEGLFLSVGTLLSSHVDDLLPLIDGIKSLSDTVPPLLRPEDLAQTLAEVRSRFETLFGGNGEQRALQVRVLLDSFPAVAAPLGIVAPPEIMAPPAVDASSPSVAEPSEIEASPQDVQPVPVEGSPG